MASSTITFDVGTPADDAEVRRLYRDNPMGGAISLSLEREPDASLAAGIEGDAHQTIVARRAGGGLCAVGTRSVRWAYVNGEPARVGYLGGLRVDADRRGDPRLLLRGYAKLRELHEADGSVRLYLTSIVTDNAAARRVLEAGLRGMPAYRFAGEFVTLVMRSRYSGRARAGGAGAGLRVGRDWDRAMPTITALHAAPGEARQFAPVWSGAVLASPKQCRGLSREHVRVARRAGAAVACAALWDQRAYKQAVVRRYAPALARCRPMLNAAAAVVGRPRLPAVGRPWRSAFASHVAGPADAVVPVIEALLSMTRRRSIDYLMAGFAAGDERLAALRRAFGGRELRTRLYVVHWPDGRADADALDGRAFGPEVAVL